ncbi:MAG: VWA domain-containing protein, partial [Kiritimatiellaceae bacterium]|nr:VWA domain-containing protein [Kiritimatiellaceae bacterium]
MDTQHHDPARDRGGDFMILKCPWMLGLWLLLPLLGKLLMHAHRKQRFAAEQLRGKRPDALKVFRRQVGLRLSSVAVLILALAQPAWNPRPHHSGFQKRDLVIALDISRSMLAADVFPTRLDAAKIAVFDALDSLRGQQTGLITFAGAASVRVPLTLDQNFIRFMLKRAEPSDADVGSTSLQSAIEKAIDVVFRESEKGQQDLILLTDGEDLISDIKKTAEELRECGARVLIIGIGDPIAGANIPDGIQTNTWMQHNGSNVVTRLDEQKLTELAADSPNVTYYPARTQPFDIHPLYRAMLVNTPDLPSSETGPIRYTEGYPGLIALALGLWILSLHPKLIAMLLLCFIAGCSPRVSPLEKEIQIHLGKADTLWTDAQSVVETDPLAAITTLRAAREAFLRAALLQPGSEMVAQNIAGVSAQIRLIEQTLHDQKQAESDLQKKLQAALDELKALTQREVILSQQCQQLLKKYPPATPEESLTAASSSHTEQSTVAVGTQNVLEVIDHVRSILRTGLTRTFGESQIPPTTELDQAVEKLVAAR